MNRKEKILSKIPDYPQRIVVELTPLCDLSCSMCPRHYIQSNDGYMSWELWRKLVDEIASTAPQTIILPFWRGESLLHSGFVEFMDYALDKSLKIHMCTNGQQMAVDHMTSLARLEFVTFSIHSPKGYANAKEFLSIRENGKPITQVSFVEGEPTEKFLKELVTDPQLSGFDSVRLYKEHTKNGVFGSLGYSIEIPRIFCGKLIDTLVIAYDGTVSRCNHIWETEKLSVNNMSIKEAWGSDTLQEIRNDYPDARCKPCDQWTGHTCGATWRVVNGVVEYTEFGV